MKPITIVPFLFILVLALPTAAISGSDIFSNPADLVDPTGAIATPLADVVAKAQADYRRTRGAVDPGWITVVTTPIPGGWLVELSQVRKPTLGQVRDLPKTKVRNVAVYRAAGAAPAVLLGKASIADRLAALETSYAEALGSIDRSPKRWEAHVLYANRLYLALMRGLQRNEPTAVADYRAFLARANVLGKPEIGAYRVVTKNLLDKFRWDLEASGLKRKPKDVLERIRVCRDEAAALYERIQAAKK